MGRPAKEESWLSAAVDQMVTHSLSLRQAAAEAGVAVSPEEAETIYKRKSFQRLLWTARHKAAAEIANDPERTKDALVGNLQLIAQKLTEEGSLDKAAEVLFKIAKIQDWVGSESTVNVFGNLSAAEFNDLRKTFQQPKPNIETPETVN